MISTLLVSQSKPSFLKVVVVAWPHDMDVYDLQILEPCSILAISWEYYPKHRADEKKRKMGE